MITLYNKKNSLACEQALIWFRRHNIEVNIQGIETITEREIFQLIYLSDLEVLDILRKDHKFSPLLHRKRNKIAHMRFSDSLSYLEHHYGLLQLPIIVSPYSSLSGFNEDKMNQFLNKNENMRKMEAF